MLGFRPKPSALYLERPRLSRLLPEEPGYVLWLEAPYGYGKSVLITQWTARLEEAGWRVVWLGLVGEDPHRGLARLLELPEAAPWTVILERLRATPTAVVLEDLEPTPGEVLGPLLRHNPGLILLASRKRLREPELPRLRSQGRLLHLKAEQLAFTPEEAERLFGDPKRSREAWEKTGGWSLPLHLAALTGQVPRPEELWEGIRLSLEAEEWREVSFLAALDYLPQEAARPLDRRLTELGFVQALERGYRLHPLAAEQIRGSYPEAVRAAVRAELERLEPRWRGLALERAELWEELEELLLNTPHIGEGFPVEVERWERCLPPTPDPRRALVRQRERAYALGKLGRGAEAAGLFLEVAVTLHSTPQERLLAYGEAVYELSKFDLARARQVVAEGDQLLAQADAETAAHYLNASAGVDYWAGDIRAAAERYRRALELAPPGPLPSSCRYNLALMQWWLDGDGAALLAARQAILDDPQAGLSRTKRAFYCRNAGIKAAMTGFTREAKRLLEETLEYADVDPLSAIQAEAMLRLLEGDLPAMPTLWARLKAWDNPNAEDRVLHKWILALLEAGQVEEALSRLAEDRALPHGLTPLLRPLVWWFAGRGEEALQALPEPLDPVAERERCLLIRAARYRILRDEAELEAFLGLTVERERPLSYYIPLPELPPHRPELARHYPLSAVLESGAKEAIALRLSELPPLEIRMLGRFEVRRLGESVALNPRPRDVLLLMALGLPRGQIAEAVWPEADSEKSRNNLHVTLNQLRKTLEPWGVATYLFESGLRRVWCDGWELQRALEEGDVPTVMRLYGKLAPEADLSEVAFRRERLEREVLEAVLKSVTAQHAEERLEWVLQHDPFHEEAFRRLLEVWVGSGRRVTALRRYREFARRLQTELGLEPALQTRQVLA